MERTFTGYHDMAGKPVYEGDILNSMYEVRFDKVLGLFCAYGNGETLFPDDWAGDRTVVTGTIN